MSGSARPAGDARTPLLSVVIPTHNVRPWLRQSLDSVLRQLEDLEVIVVDDASTDGTPDLARSVAERDPRVVVVDSPGRGGGSARNAGAARARGRYLVFADGDDLIPDGAYQALTESLEASGSDMAVGDYLKFRAVDTWRPTAAMPAFDRPARGVALADEPTLAYSRPCWNRAFRSEFWRDSGIAFPDVPRSNDIVPMVRALLAARTIDIVPDVVYVYRERPGAGSMTARAGGAASLVSYLEQETECARLVAEAGIPELSDVFGRLVWDRDGFVAVTRYLLAWQEPTDDDERVEHQLRLLLEKTPVPDEVGPLRRITLELAARGRFAAAHAAARVAGGHRDGTDPSEERADLVATWRAFLEEVPADALTEDEASMVVERLARQLAQPRGDGDPSAWGALVAEATRALGPRVRLFAADAWQAGTGDAARIAAREEVAPRVQQLAGGDVLVIEGAVAPGSREARPALLDGEASIADSALRVIEPASVAWRVSDDGVRTFHAAFPAHALPLHRPLTPVAILDDGSAIGVEARLELPPYSERDAFLYDVVDRVLVVRRRRGRIARGARGFARRGARAALRRLGR